MLLHEKNREQNLSFPLIAARTLSQINGKKQKAVHGQLSVVRSSLQLTADY
jgi:hypothetical protein